MLAGFASPFLMANYPDGLEGSKSWIRDTERNRTSFKLVPVCWLPGHYSRFTLVQKENQATKCPKHQCHLVLSLLCSSLLNSIWWVKGDWRSDSVGVAVTPHHSTLPTDSREERRSQLLQKLLETLLPLLSKALHHCFVLHASSHTPLLCYCFYFLKSSYPSKSTSHCNTAPCSFCKLRTSKPLSQPTFHRRRPTM